MRSASPCIDARDGRTSNCGALEAFTLRALRLLSFLLRPIHLRGFYRLSRLFLGLTGVNPVCQVRLANDIALYVDLRDPYWNRLIAPFFHYEPEMEHILVQLKDEPYELIDCGANMGYWSVLASSRQLGNHHALAIEPLLETYRRLSLNCVDNGGRFSVYNNAIASESGLSLTLHKPGGHASVSLVAEEGSEAGHTQRIETITVDDMVRKCGKTNGAGPFILKLDVEGVEIQALEGAAATLDTKPLIIYEDHGKEVDSPVSRYVMDILGLRVFFVEDNGDKREMDSVEEINALKTDRQKGYNFFAMHSDSPFLQCCSWASERGGSL